MDLKIIKQTRIGCFIKLEYNTAKRAKFRSFLSKIKKSKTLGPYITETGSRYIVFEIDDYIPEKPEEVDKAAELNSAKRHDLLMMMQKWTLRNNEITITALDEL